MKRKVAAIFAADIAGRSRLVADDAQETLRRLAFSRHKSASSRSARADDLEVCETAYSRDRAQMTSCSAMTIWPDPIATSFPA
ncbi:hypothetical protein [Bradyrhizobium elkanii]|uniref:hypothetical protein n=1 Tax=Bradyrhizobium elkanii TaxID=29448 RepID=UPI0020138900|nr:hypothetical protein [Bradyrhizobium elkanii]